MKWSDQIFVRALREHQIDRDHTPFRSTETLNELHDLWATRRGLRVSLAASGMRAFEAFRLAGSAGSLTLRRSVCVRLVLDRMVNLRGLHLAGQMGANARR